MDDGAAGVLVIGAGPAGISAALALAETGHKVHLMDPARATIQSPPPGDYLDLRSNDDAQWQWQLGEHFGNLRTTSPTSPKLRSPGLRGVFEGYEAANHLRSVSGFHIAGALAAGGMSNAWGCGVTRFTRDELGPLGSVEASMQQSYARVANRMGLSGANDDGIRDAVGVDEWAQPALPMDRLHASLYQRRNKIVAQAGLSLGRTRLAVLAQPRGARQGCDLAGMCLWGCSRQATWSAAFELPALIDQPGVFWHPGWCAERLEREPNGGWRVHARGDDNSVRTFESRRVFLAAGTLATTRLVLDSLSNRPSQVRLLSNPMAAFLLCLPAFLGQARERAFSLAQLSLRMDILGDVGAAWAHTFSTAGLPVSEFLPYLPMTRRAGLPLLRSMLPATVLGNVFFPGALSAHSASLQADGALKISGGEADGLVVARETVRNTLHRAFRRGGAWMLPGSYIPGALGADLHYAATHPIRLHPESHECHITGEVAGLPGVYVVDGASLPTLPAKAHTLTIMANADRIARGLALDSSGA